MSTYKGFDINTNTTPAPWGTREQAMVQDVIDTLVVGTVSGAKDAVNGHQHGQLCDAIGNPVVLITDSGATVTIKSNGNMPALYINGLAETTKLALSVDSGGNSLIEAVNGDMELVTYSTGTIYIEPSDGLNVCTATSQTLGFYGKTPIAQQSGSSYPATATTAAVSSGAWGFSTSTQANAIITELNGIRTILADYGLIG